MPRKQYDVRLSLPIPWAYSNECFGKSFPGKQLLLCGKYRNVVLKAKPTSEQQQAETFHIS